MAKIVTGVTGVQPVSGVTGRTITDPEATAAQRLGDPADPRHGVIDRSGHPYPWEEFPGESHGPYGLENELLGMDVASYSSAAGRLGQDPTADLTPITHAAPWPAGVPQSVDPDEAYQRRSVSNAIHATNMGGSREALYEPTLNALQDTWEELYDVTPGELIPPMAPIPDQIKTGSAGWGSTDRVHSFARQNGYGFGSAHMHRRFATGSIPGNYMWLEPGSRPLVKSMAGTAMVPVGQDSPFYGQDPGVPFDPQGSALMVLPAAYQAAPDPQLAATLPYIEAPAVELW